MRGRPPMSARARVWSIGLAIALTALPGAAHAREIAIEHFDVDVAVHPTSVIDVTERIRFRFTGQWNGVIRDIPVRYRTPQGFAFDLDLSVVAITDGAGQTYRYESSRVRHYRRFKIYVPGAVDASRDVVIHYRVPNALRFFQDHDELYWNITGDEWEMPIENATARIELPADASGVRATAFTGAYGSRARDASVQIEGPVVTFQMQRRLDFREGLTAVIGWDKGAVRQPPATAGVWRFVRNNWILLFPVLIFFVMYRAWARWGRDPAARPVAVQYEPPAGLTPAECGTLLDHRLDARDVTATIVDLAVHGFLSIAEKEKSILVFKSHDYELEMKQKPPAWSTLKFHERRALSGLFKDGVRPTVLLSELKNDFYSHIPVMRTAVYDALIKAGFYARRPDKSSRGFFVFGLIVTLTSLHTGAFGSGIFGVPMAPIVIAQVLSGLVIMGFSVVMPARTEAGARAAEAIRGFEEFLSRVEADRIDRVVRTPEMFERFLPFAMAFGVEERWAHAFEDIVTTSPTWYHGGSVGSFHTGQFSAGLGDFSSRASSTLSSSPRSSGGSGFGGGGSSGGGGGGGGGSGF
jgi:uncharacterized membrane protein